MSHSEIFNAAVKLAPGERAAFLDRACGANRELRDEVESLLQAHDAPDSFLREPVDRTGASEPIAERPGVVGPYKLLEQIGVGGFGLVFMAEQSQPVRRKVALKILKPGMDTRQVVARFEAERQALALMDHPNIAKVFDGGATPSGRPYFVMELVKGVPITEFCDQNHLTPRQRLELFVSVCQAVQHAHQKGIIHRDLKPSNVLVMMQDTTPVPKVIDFGIAKALGQELTDKTLFTGFAQMIGSPLYMSPEQAGQSGLDIDTRSDIYSLGVLLYELLTGTTPVTKERFREATYDEIRRIIREEEPPKPSTRLSDSKDSLPSISQQRHTEPTKLTRLVRGELDWIVMKALEKDRGRRYDTANSFAADVERYLADEPVQACPPSAWYRFRKFARRNRRVLITAGVVVLALLVAVGSLAFAVASLSESKTAIESALGAKSQALVDLQSEKDKADQALAGEQEAAYARAVAVAHLAHMTGELDQANEALDERPPGQRHWEWYYLKRLCQKGQVLHRLGRPRNAKYSVTPDGRFVAELAGNSLSVFDTQLRKRVFELREEKAAAGPHWLSLSADGRRLAGVSLSMLRVWDVATGKQTHQLTPTGQAGITHAVFSPNGRVLAWGNRGDIRFTDLETNQDVSRVRTIPVNATTWVFTPDGSRLVTAGETGVIEVWDVAAGVRLHQHKEPAGPTSLAVSPDGRLYAVPTNNAVRVCELDTARVVHVLLTPNLKEAAGEKVHLTFSSDGKRLVHTSSDRTVSVWDTTTGQQLRSFPSAQDVWYAGYVERSRRILTVEAGGIVRVRDDDSGPQGLAIRGVRSAAFSPDGRQVAVAYRDGNVCIVEVATGTAVRELPKQGATDRGGLAFSPDGQWLATVNGLDPEVKVWEVRTGKLVTTLPCRADAADTADMVAFSPDGRQLAARLTDKKLTSKHVRVWETELWREVLTRPTPQRDPAARLRFAYSPDGRRLAVTCGDDRVLIWNAATGQGERVIQEPGCSFSIVGFDPRTGRIAAGNADGAVYLWDGATGERLSVLRVSPGIVTSLAFSPDGRRLACATLATYRAPEVRIWDTRSGRSLLVFNAQGTPTLAQFSPDGHRLMTGSTVDGIIHIWDGSPMEEPGRIARTDTR